MFSFFPPSVVLTSERTSAAGLRTDFSNFLPSLLNGGDIGIRPKQFEIFCPSLSHWRYECCFDERKQKILQIVMSGGYECCYIIIFI